ncbi:DnaJ domain-containing protein [Planctomycetales bacterium ZRK34]|nr:DnaJ domain-containing protein [Planctomycetales bacterium ZRK34]
MAQNDSHYDVLGVSRAAGPRRIEKAYRRRVRSVHPDVNKASDALQQFYCVQRAYETLIDPQKRLDYDYQVAVQRGLINDVADIVEPRHERTESPARPKATTERVEPATEQPAPSPSPSPRKVRTYGYGRPVVYMPSYRRHSKRRHERQLRRMERRNRMVQYGLVAACVLAGVISLYQVSQIVSFTSPVEAAFYNQAQQQAEISTAGVPAVNKAENPNDSTDPLLEAINPLH